MIKSFDVGKIPKAGSLQLAWHASGTLRRASVHLVRRCARIAINTPLALSTRLPLLNLCPFFVVFPISVLHSFTDTHYKMTRMSAKTMLFTVCSNQKLQISVAELASRYAKTYLWLSHPPNFSAKFDNIVFGGKCVSGIAATLNYTVGCMDHGFILVVPYRISVQIDSFYFAFMIIVCSNKSR